MSADLDDMFAALGHHADALPLAPATQLRRRGERRRRNRVVAAAAAVLLIAAGSGVVAWHREHRPVLPAAPNAPVRGLKPVPDPVPAGEGREWVYPTVADHRVFAVSRSSATSYRLVAVDERTGRVLWSTPDRTGDATHPFTVPGAVLLHTEKSLEIRDAATGADRWQLRFDRQDQIVLSADVVVRTTATNGTTEAFDMRTGALRWSVPGGADRPAYTFGNRGEDGVFRAQLLFQGTFSTGTLGQRLRSGRTLVRDLHTGRTLHSLDPEPPAEQIRVQDGTLFWLAGAQVRTAAMDGRDGGSRVLRTLPRGWRLESYFACGTGRICLIESASKDYREGRVVVVDVASARVLWQQAVPYAVGGSAADGRVLVADRDGTTLFDGDGRKVFATQDDAGWIDAGNLLTIGPSGALTAVATASGATAPLGTPLAVDPERCLWSGEAITCADGAEMRILRFTR